MTQAFAHPFGAHRPVVDAAGIFVKAGPEFAEAPLQGLEVARSQVGHGVDAHFVQHLFGGRPHPVQPAHEERIKKILHLARPHHGEAVGFVEVRRDFGDQPIGPDPNAHRQPAFCLHPSADFLGDGGGAAETPDLGGDVEVRFVERSGLHDRRHFPEDLEDRLRFPAVTGEIRLEENGLRAKADGPRSGDGRTHAENPGLVGGGTNHPAAGRAATHHHGFAAQGRIVPHVDLRVEAVHIAVEDAPGRRHGRYSTPCLR